MAGLRIGLIVLDEDEKRLWLRSVADILLDPFCMTIYAGGYENRNRVGGYSFCFAHPYGRDGRCFLMLSRHNTLTLPSRELMASDLTSPICEMREGNYGAYENRSSIPGLFASVRCGNNWYMISQAGVIQPLYGWCFPGLGDRGFRPSARHRTSPPWGR
jgi:hypothetical protein